MDKNDLSKTPYTSPNSSHDVEESKKLLQNIQKKTNDILSMKKHVEQYKNQGPSIVFAGPPQSGKTVLFSRIEKYFDRENTIFMQGFPDGEGKWSFMADTEVAYNLRQKRPFTEKLQTAFHERLDAVLPRWEMKLIDLGGKISDMNKKFLQESSHYILVLRKDLPEESKAWKEFAEQYGNTCLGIIYSELKGETELKNIDGKIEGTIANLSRKTKDHIELEVLANTINGLQIMPKKEDIISYPTESHIPQISLTHLAKSLNIENKSAVADKFFPYWRASDLSKTLYSIEKYTKDMKTLWLDGGAPAFLYSTLTLQAREKELWISYPFAKEEDFPEKRIPIRSLSISDTPSEAIIWNKKETDSYTFLDCKIAGGNFDIKHLEHLQIPQVNLNKGIILSGALPVVLFSSLAKTYGEKVTWLGVYTPQQLEDAEGKKHPAMIISSKDPEILPFRYINIPKEVAPIIEKKNL